MPSFQCLCTDVGHTGTLLDFVVFDQSGTAGRASLCTLEHCSSDKTIFVIFEEFISIRINNTVKQQQ